MKTILSSILLLGFLAPCYAAQDYEKHVKNIAAGTPEKDIAASLHALEAAGTAAFPILIAHFIDRTPADPHYFQREVLQLLKTAVAFLRKELGSIKQ